MARDLTAEYGASAADTESGSQGTAVPGDSVPFAASVTKLGLPTVVINPLRRAGISTVADLIVRSRSELMAIPQFGPAAYEQIVDALEAHDLPALRAPQAEGAVSSKVRAQFAQAELRRTRAALQRLVRLADRLHLRRSHHHAAPHRHCLACTQLDEARMVLGNATNQ